MIEQDTVRLLRECDSGVRMGLSSLREVKNRVESRGLYRALATCEREHEALESEIRSLLAKCRDNGKAPGKMALLMSRAKTEASLLLHASKRDATVASLMTDGCNMGVKSLSGYLNQYKASSEDAKDVAKRLVDSEERLARNCRGYL
ncbi:MAG: hypothetical protein J6S44_05160 [Clostridia bacterium]|nr:hypothetical protein [Clostridia bacterium]MBO5754582.1 hypothetical protein [Clostridia bacterium]